MTVSDTIRTRWEDLSARAQSRALATRPALLNRWILIEEGHEYAECKADSAEEALEEARSNVDASNYDVSSTIWIDFAVRNLVTGEVAEGTETIDPDEPECSHRDGHDWQAPYELVGGLKENPGVFGHGGGVILRRVCMRCGCSRTVDTWAQRRDTGEQGLTSTSYEPGEYAEKVDELRRASLRPGLERVLDGLDCVRRYRDGTSGEITAVTEFELGVDEDGDERHYGDVVDEIQAAIDSELGEGYVVSYNHTTPPRIEIAEETGMGD